ncbi:MAG: GGDEF domain-containing protein [Gemmataceae bacterium]|nr:GGDEF domain-containing protein [Gemmataceae bacterium]MDW8267301.1 GGDEF domain-containing protein [Gemmataceae bacterium]
MQSKTKRLTRSADSAERNQLPPACLVSIYPAGKNLGTRYNLETIPWVLGHDAKCDIRLEDESVSRRHAIIQPEPDGYHVIDLQSTNGTYVNETRVSRSLLKNGDILRVGVGIYRFLSGDDLEASYREEIYRLTIMDALTELPNKRYSLEFLGRALGYGIRYRQPLALLMLDIDHLRAINDQLSYLAGDMALRQLATLLRRHVRREDLFSRYEGGTFLVVLPGTNHGGAGVLAERLRKLAEGQTFQFEGRAFRLTVSIGISALTGEDWQTSSELVEQARQKLAEAKRLGGNRVVG